MLGLVILFLMALVLGSRSGKPDFWFGAGLVLLVLVGLCLVWLELNQWPHLFSSGFVAHLGKLVVTTVFGLMIGGIVWGGGWKRKNIW
jgi:Na+/melibiose symporter-like transporter